MVTLVVELMSSLVAYLVGSAVAACCGRGPDVLSTPPLATLSGHFTFNISRKVKQTLRACAEILSGLYSGWYRGTN